MRLLLVRHGESVCGVNGVVGGPRGCTGLTDRGRAQVDALRERFERTGEADGATVLSSTLPRAVETAEILAPALGVDEVPAVHELRELDPGEADALTWDRFREVYGSFDMVEELERPLAPGGESLGAFRARVEGVIDGLVAEHDGGTVVAACHGGVVFMSLVLLLGLPRPRAEAGIHPDFSSITEWTRADDRWWLVRYNDAAHVRGTDLLPAEAPPPGR